jgi:hypothetical protein
LLRPHGQRLILIHLYKGIIRNILLWPREIGLFMIYLYRGVGHLKSNVAAHEQGLNLIHLRRGRASSGKYCCDLVSKD